MRDGPSDADDDRGDPDPAEPEVALAPATVSAWPTGREVVLAAFRDAAELLLAHLPVARVGTEPEGVHQCRVAVRRMRSDLRTFRPLLDPTWARSLQSDLGAFASAFGAVRDDDVLLIAFRDVDAPAALLAAIDAERATHHRALITTLDAPATQALLDRVVAAATDPRTAPQADDPADDLLRPLARRPWTKLRRAVEALDDESSDEDFHDVRLLTKRCRYTAIAVGPAFGPVAIDFAKALGKLQDALGDRNDAHVMATRLRASAATFDADVVFAAGEAVGKLQARAEASGDRWKRAWKRASAKELRAWL